MKIWMKNLSLRADGSLSDVCCILTLWQQQTRPGRIKLQWDPGCCDGISTICSHGHCLRVTLLHFQGQKAAGVIFLLVQKVVPTSGSAGLKLFGIQRCPEFFSSCFSKQQPCSWAHITDVLLKSDRALYVFMQTHLQQVHIPKHSKMNMENLKTCTVVRCPAVTVWNSYLIIFLQLY